MASSTVDSRSFVERLTGSSWPPLWTLRLFACLALAPVVLAMFVFKSGNRHDFCLGLTVGILVGMVVQSFAISSIELKQGEQPSDVESLSVLR